MLQGIYLLRGRYCLGFLQRLPIIPPITIEGAETPPLPPELIVNPVAKILANAMVTIESRGAGYG